MFPFVIVIVAYFFVAATIAIGVVGFNLAALRPLIRAPRHVVRLLTSRSMRRNHALEHATINVYEQRHRRSALTGMPAIDGFYLRGRADPDMAIASGQQAIQRLRAGEKRLAVHRRCPTSLVGSQLLLSALFSIVFVVVDYFTAPTFLLALLAGAVLGASLSPILQRVALVDPNIGGLEIRDLEIEEPSGRLSMLSSIVFAPMFVRTSQSRRARRSRDRGDGKVTLITPDATEIAAGNYRVRD